MCISKPLLLLLCVWIQIQLHAQQYPFVHYTPKDGLVNSRVRTAYQDSKGRMYFTTYGGLSVYDGARFKNYTIQNGLLSDLVNDVLEVADDSLLVAVNTCGLNVLVHGQMKQLEIARKFCPIVNRLLKSTDGNIYATTDDGLYHLNHEKFEKIPVAIPGQNIAATFLGPIIEYKDLLIFSTYNSNRDFGLFLYNKKTTQVVNFLANVFVYSLEADANGSLWIGTNKNTLQIDTLALVKGKLELVRPFQSLRDTMALPGGIIQFNSQNELFLSPTSSEIIHYRKDGAVQHIISPEPSTSSSQYFFIDREDVLWICHDGNGVYKLPGTKFQSVISPLNNNKSGVRNISGVTNDAWWVIMKNSELILQTPSGKKSYTSSPSIDVNFLLTTEKYIYAADAHVLYMAASPKGNETSIRFQKIISIPDTVSFGGQAMADKDGDIIMSKSDALCVIRDDKLLFTCPLSPSDLVEGMHIDPLNRLWVISRYSGLEIFSIHPGSPAAYLEKEFLFAKEFEGVSPRSMVVDQDGKVWVGTRNNGLLAFSFDNSQLKKTGQYQTQNGLTDNFVTALTYDKNSNIIVGTQTGLDKLIKTKEGYRPENITKSNNTFTYINYVWTDSDNNAYAWSNTGEILRIEPAVVSKNIIEPRLLLEGIKINGQNTEAPASSLILHYRQRNITFSVAAPSFIDEKQIKYSYLLSGAGNKEWSDTTTVADINLLNLTPGHYKLFVKAFFSSTNYSSKETEFSFTILPPWWQTWWFRVTMGLIAIGLLVVGFRAYYRRKFEKQRALLEKKQAVEKERTRIASDMHDDLGAGLSTIRFLSEKVKRNSFSEVTKDDAAKIVSNSDELMQKMNEIIWAMNEKNDSLEDLIFYTRSYAMEYCTENGLMCETHLPDLIPPVFVSGETRRNVFLIVKESLHNTMKHAQAKKVNIDITIAESLMISIKDDGKGFVENNLNAGNGLRNMQKRIGLLKGNLEIINGNGTQIKMTLPLPL